MQHWLVVSDNSGQPISPIFKGQAIPSALCLEMSWNDCPRTSL